MYLGYCLHSFRRHRPVWFCLLTTFQLNQKILYEMDSLRSSSSLITQPAEILDLILNKSASLSLSERIGLRVVSPLFQAVIEDSLQMETSLVIRIGSYGCTNVGVYTKPDHLIVSVDNFKKTKFIQLFTRLFPKTIVLTIDTGSIVAWRFVPQLLAPFLGQLQAVKLSGKRMCLDVDNPNEGEAALFESLSKSFNAMSALTFLHLDIWNFPWGLMSRLGPTLARLQKFTFPDCRFQSNTKIPSFIARSLSGSHCTHLILKKCDFQLSTCHFLGQLASSLTHLQLAYCPNTILKSISSFHRLTVLILGNIESLDALLGHLHSLSQLRELELRTLDNLALFRPPRWALPSIQRLTLQLYLEKPDELFFSVSSLLSNIVSSFPNLSHITFCCDQRHHSRIRANLPQVPFTINILNLNELPRFGW